MRPSSVHEICADVPRRIVRRDAARAYAKPEQPCAPPADRDLRTSKFGPKPVRELRLFRAAPKGGRSQLINGAHD
jgi:hypothetical protein